MGKRTRVVGDDSYEDLASAYQVVLVSMLDQALRDSGITPKAKRRKICERFLYAHGAFHDQYWLKSGGKTVYPFLGFAEIFQNIGMSPEQLGKIIASKDKSFSFDEYVWSVMQCYFQPDKRAPSVDVGAIGEEPS